ncbi:MAG: immunoglobulin domain-containing protein [Verrucomicrobia bacterium]|nr:immunoglobulin domain-containing protein [Verrucomicrobiota bacterium]MBI3868754.1 immunoglobulin domain-containing protein [Verrucomicrobiota bacterium]
MALLVFAPDFTSAVAAPPPNDNFASARLLTGGSGSVAGTNEEATREADELDHAGNPGGKSVWYVWHCSSGGTLSVALVNAGFGYALAVYTGKSMDSLTPITSSQSSSLSLSLTPGTVYRIAVDGLDGASGSFDLRWKQTLLPGRGPDLTVPRELIQLKIAEQNFPASDCEVSEHCVAQGKRRLLRFDMHTVNIGTEDLVFGPPGDSPLFQFAPCHNHYHFEALAAYRVLTISNELVRVGNKFGFCLEDVLNTSGIPGAPKTYSCDYQGIQAGWSDIYNADLPCQYVDLTGLPPGDYQLEIELDPLKQIPESNEENNLIRVPFYLPPTCSGPPSNDAFLDAQPLVGRVVTALGDTTCATRQSGEPSHAPDDGGLPSRSIWFSWVAPDALPVVMSTEGSAFDTVLAVYEGSTVDPHGNNRVANNNDIAKFVKQSRVSFVPVAGRRYSIAVDGSEQSDGVQGGLVVININPSGNDAFGSCEPLSGGSGTALGSILNATIEDAEPAFIASASDASVWYCWTAPSTDTYSFDTVGSAFNTLLAVYTGASLDALSVVASDDDSGGVGTSRVTFQASAGTEYRVAVAAKKGLADPITTAVYQLSWRGSSPSIAPVIVTQPGSVTTFVGGEATFSVGVKGSVPLSYRWFHGSDPMSDGPNATGSETATLHLTQLLESDRGVYRVHVSNPVSSVDSVSVNLVAATPNRVVFVEPMTVVSGSMPVVGVSMAARGGENSLRFSLSYDPALLMDPLVQLASDLPMGSQLEVDATQSAFGWLGLRIQLPPGASPPLNNIRLAWAQFQLAGGLMPDQRLSICFEDEPVAREVRAEDGSLLPALYACGNLIVSEHSVLSGRFRDDGVFELTLQGTPDAPYEFQFSTDLVSWSILDTQSNTPSGALVIVDDLNHQLSQCFYRAVRK